MNIQAREHPNTRRPEYPNSVCNLCGGTATLPLRGASLQHLVQCAACGLVRVREMPTHDTVQRIYGEDYYRNANSHVVGYEDYAADMPNILKTAHRRLRLIERYCPVPGRLLDVGCALGFFMEAARQRGWDVTGIDISSYAVAAAKRRLGARVLCGQIPEMNFATASFDVITMWDVVEHMTDPLQQLQECHRVLKDGGLLVLCTPDISSRVAQVTGERWMGFKLADEHLYYFSRDTARKMLDKAGFETLRAFHIGKYVTLAFFCKRLALYAPRLAAVLGRLVTFCRVGHLSLYVNPRDIVCLVARKPTGVR
ncbi:MAG: class I SAM-dependent methyltransferase [Abditibacteriales bacterium]|nr:class I SAM-dependent methyltransferase [Abditibacteriales bacterium]